MFRTLSKQQEKLLQTSPLFDSLTPEQIRPVLYCLQAEVRRAAPRQIIIQPQECSSGLFIVLSGAIELVHTDAGGRKSTMNILYPGDCHCENVGLLDALSAQVQVLALDEVTMIKLDINRIFAPDSCQCPYKLAVVENLVRILSADNDFLKLKATLFSQKSLRSKLRISRRSRTPTPCMSPSTAQSWRIFWPPTAALSAGSLAGCTRKSSSPSGATASV